MTRPSDLSVELELAVRLADAADALTLPAFERRDFTLDWKDNATEVTEIDRGTEALLADILAAERPGHARVGEEHGRAGDPDSPWCWIVDPIDGTSGFVRGIPVWATLIALTHVDHGVVVGMVSAPALDRRWWAVRDGGAFVDGRRCQVSGVAELAEAQVSLTPNDGWDRLGLLPALTEIGRRARRVRGFGDFWQHCLVAEGALDLAVDAVGVAPYDLAAVRVIVEEAGGSFTDRFGEPTHEHDTAISSNGLLHDEVIRRLNARSGPRPAQESVWDYPRPPAVVADPRLVIVGDPVDPVARTTDAVRVLETASPPTFYVPPHDVRLERLVPAPGRSVCEWKGEARYWALAESPEVAIAWEYPQPRPRFAELAGYLSFYPGRIPCTVAGERVRPQAGGFYGGWITDEIVGPFKGDPGTGHW